MQSHSGNQSFPIRHSPESTAPNQPISLPSSSTAKRPEINGSTQRSIKSNGIRNVAASPSVRPLGYSPSVRPLVYPGSRPTGPTGHVRPMHSSNGRPINAANNNPGRHSPSVRPSNFRPIRPRPSMGSRVPDDL